ncbi:hypothetical protein [Dyella lutea]|uniref:Phage protein n=1 Tax=Dyella lutea TaxID=2950441 RepID=A0ABT1FF52_9GAMM|nr:hypothetical protein [Dyella lutea]MCP1375986.1 hypothetical protein [Dyella lutea]
MAKIDELRDHLFETLKSLRDEKNPMDIARAKAVADVAQVVINSARVEVEAMKVTGAKVGTGFLPAADQTNGPRSPEERERDLRKIQRDRA